MQGEPPLSIIDYPMEDYFPKDFMSQLLDAVFCGGKIVRKGGRGHGSLEPSETAGIDYVVVIGSEIKRWVPWLYEWFASDHMVGLVSEAVGEDVLPSVSVSSPNINFLIGQGRRYELHEDSRPYTVILYPHSLGDGDGGGLVYRQPGNDPDTAKEVNVQSGTMVIFDGTRYPHAVLPLEKSNVFRLSILLMYYPVAAGDVVPAGLDDYLFDEGPDKKPSFKDGD